MSETKEKEFHDAPEKKVRQHKLKKEVKKDNSNNLILALNYLQENFDFRFNLFAAKPEYKKKVEPETAFSFFDERAANNLHSDIKLYGKVSLSKYDFDMLIGSDKLSPDYDPIRKYIFGLPIWDGTERFKLFLQQIQLKDESQRDHLNRTFKKWFVMYVAALIDDTKINDTCFVLSGKQARGKTRFLESLVPRDLRFYYSYSGTFDPHNKDHLEMIATKMQIILDEMETLTRTDQGTLKTTMSQRFINLRRAFGHAPIFLFRKASFCGSINFDDFLTDVTGNRRWLPFAIDNIDVDESFDISLLYAEALALHKAGFQTWFDKDEIAELEKYNERFRRPSPEEELITINFAKPTKEEVELNTYDILYMTSTEIMHDLASRDDYRKMNTNDSVAVRIGRIMKRLGFDQVCKRVNDNPVKLWIVKKVAKDYAAKQRESKSDIEIQGEMPI